MIVEMRTYRVKIGAVPAVEQRFAEALPERVKLSPFGGLFHTEVGTINQIVHLWPYESAAERDRIRAASLKVPGWPPKILEFLVEMKSEILTPAPFSPAMEPRALGNLYEIRRYTFQPGAVQTLIKRWGEKIEGRMKLSPLVGCWYTEHGELNQWVHMWAYKDFAHRAQVRQEASRQKVWPPDAGEFYTKMENILVVPAACSPLH